MEDTRFFLKFNKNPYHFHAHLGFTETGTEIASADDIDDFVKELKEKKIQFNKEKKEYFKN